MYVARPDAPRDQGLPVQQSDDDARLQQAHRDHIFRSGEHYKEFASPTNLVREVFYDLGLNPETVKVNNLPFKTLGSLFKGREGFLRQIREALGRVDHRGHQRFAAITASASAATVHGLGGIGKTRAAIEYAHRHADDFTALLFVRADSPSSLQQNLAALCGPLVLDLAEKEARETEVQVAAVLRWLQQHPGWFLIFDNVDTEDAARAVEALLSQLSAAGQVLVTSRLSGWSGAVESLALDVLAEADAAAFLLERTDERRRKHARRSRPGPAAGGGARSAGPGAGAGRGLHRQAPADLRAIPGSVAQQARRGADLVRRAADAVSLECCRDLANVVRPAHRRRPRSIEPAGLVRVRPDPGIAAGRRRRPVGRRGFRKTPCLQPIPTDALADLEAYSLVTRAAESPTLFRSPAGGGRHPPQPAGRHGVLGPATAPCAG